MAPPKKIEGRWGIDADVRVPDLVLMRAPLGQRGSYLPTEINVLQGVGATVPSFLLSFGLASIVAVLSERSASGPAPA